MKLEQQLREKIRQKGHSYNTEKAYALKYNQYVQFLRAKFGEYRHPAQVGKQEIQGFLSYLANEQNVANDTQRVALAELRKGEVNSESVKTLTAVFGIHESALSELVQKWTPQTMGPKVSRMELFSTKAGQVACSPELAKVPRDGIVG